MRDADAERSLLIRERRFLLGLMLILGIAALWVVHDYVAWALIGLVLGYVCLPAQLRLEARMKPIVAALLIVVAISLVVAIPVVALAITVKNDFVRILSSFGDGGLESWIAGVLGRFLPAETAASVAASAGAKIGEYALEAAPEILVALVDASVGVFILGSAMFAVLLKRKQIEVWMRRVVPLRRDREEAFFFECRRALDAVLYGIVVVAALQAITGGLIWWAAGLPSPIFWTFVMFGFSMVPALGPSMVLLPGAIYAWLNGDTTAAIMLVVGTVIAIGFIDYFIRPAIIQRKGDLDPTITLLSIVGGVTTMGMIGILLGPIIAAMFLHVTELTMQTHRDFGGDYDSELFEPEDPIVGEKPDAS